MEPQFIVEIDCTKEEMHKTCYEYANEIKFYKYGKLIVVFLYVFDMIPFLFFRHHFNIFLSIGIALFVLALILYVFYMPLFLQYFIIMNQNNVSLKQLSLMKKRRTLEDLEQIKILKKGHITGILIFYQDHFEYADIINQTYLDIEYFYEKDDHFVLVSHSRKMVFLIRKTQFLQGNSEMFGQFINEKRNRLSTNKT